jgi:hypothetical protein
VRDLLRQHFRFFLYVALAGLALRLLFILRFGDITPDAFAYGDIAKNWLQHGIYGLSGTNGVSPTYTRLPGYPAFLAVVFAIFGMEHYRTVMVLQAFIDLVSCFLIADIALRLISPRAAKIAFLLAAICPFLANYVAAPLTETLEIFFTVLAFDFALIGLKTVKVRPWFFCGLATAGAILLRPDGGILLIAICGYLFVLVIAPSAKRTMSDRLALMWSAIVVAVVALAPLLPWGLRNLHTLHRFQPLAPRYATDQDEYVPMGFNHWVKTWIADYASVEEVYWAVPGSNIDIENLPTRAFDSEQQREETEQLLDDYNQEQRVTPELDLRFAALAADRLHQSPWRYYVWLPLVRIGDMWLRPRTEILPSDVRWWEFDDDPKWSALAVVLGVVNLLYIGAALAGLVKSPLPKHFAVLLLFVVLRSAFLGTLENPEPRYTLECYPVVILLAICLKAE